jgi:uncharacterized YigZ family protein
MLARTFLSAGYNTDVKYLTVARRAEVTEIIRGSRFIGWVAPISGPEGAQELLDEARALHPTATHHCSAWKCGSEMRFSDDGEPGGTAGRPMLELILKRDLDFVAAVVIRYFGGTRLGAGGLVRAYGGTVAKALDEAGVAPVLARSLLELHVPFALLDSVYRFISGYQNLEKLAESYGSEGLVLELELISADVAAFSAELADLTSGQVLIHDRTGPLS